MKLSDFKGQETKAQKPQNNITEDDIMEKYNSYKDLSSDQLNQ